ncbi:MAG: hypothetical protein A2Z37_14050 [Chloroflexi bacterium RBG_19FT_COMBO_62_14]|nr:MAG: hypothetical protein A2Z37_14050 [Chloroflexi bacterium RBG_19FT_COMBO_62_14]
MTTETIQINRAPVLTLWACIVAEGLGYDHETALTLGKAVAGLNAQSKGRRLGIYSKPEPAEGEEPTKKYGLGEEFWIEICGRPVPAKNTRDGVRAVIKDEAIKPAGVEKYLASRFGESLEAVRQAMIDLASSYTPEELGLRAYGFYERFRPAIPSGKAGWGQKGELDLSLVRSLAKTKRK